MSFLDEKGVARLWQHVKTLVQNFIVESRAIEIAEDTVIEHNSAEDAHPDIRDLFQDTESLVEQHNSSTNAHQDIRELIDSVTTERANMHLKRVFLTDWTLNNESGLYELLIEKDEHNCGTTPVIYDVAQLMSDGSFASVMEDGVVDENGNVTIRLTEPMEGRIIISGLLNEYEATGVMENVVARDDEGDGNVELRSWFSPPETDVVTEGIGLIHSHVADTNNPHQITAALINALDMVDMGKVIPNGSDLNTYTKAGVYRGISSTVGDTANPLINYPEPDTNYGFKMLVMKGYGGDNYTHQFILHGNSTRLYYRLGRAGTWKGWTRLDNAYTYGTSEPSSSMGVNGDLYIQYTK